MPRIEHKNSRYLLGKYRGIVADNQDPEQRGRVRVQVTSIWGNKIHQTWALPNFPSTEVFTVPPVGSQIWVEFEQGNPDLPIWTGCFLKSTEPHEEAKDAAPKNRSIKTEESLRLSLDDEVKEIVIQAGTDSTKIILKKEDEKIIVDAEIVEVGEGATEAMVLGDSLLNYLNSSMKLAFDTHTHIVAGVDTGPGSVVSAPPAAPMPSAPGSVLSSKHKVE